MLPGSAQQIPYLRFIMHTIEFLYRRGGLPPATAFGSVSLGMTRAVGGLCAAMEQFALRAQRRRCLTRPRR